MPRDQVPGLGRLGRGFAVPVVEALDPGDDAHAPEADLLRARVVADVVRLPGAVREQRERPAKGVRDARPRRSADDRAAADRELLVSQEAGPLAVEHEEELLLGAVAVRRAVQPPVRDQLVTQSGLDRASLAAEIPDLDLAVRLPIRDAGRVVDVDDVRRPWRRLA